MGKIQAFFHYLAHLEWTEKVQTHCTFCDRSKFEANIVYEDDSLLAINNRSKAGLHHWLILPKSHRWRDIEVLVSEDAHLVQSMIRLKEQLLEKHCSTVSPADVHTGFHRGRRIFFRKVYWPDIVSIHHLHMHVIVEPRFWLKFFKYPSWLPLMWKSEKQVERELNERTKRSAKG
ncbi:HIT-like protein [Hypoxylon sp. NC0597]|nr:HIT-like protein [Hypoxylon sp. NC0597]